MPEVYCVRAEFGTYTDKFVQGEYIAIGWMPGIDLSNIHSKDELYPLYKKSHPEDASNLVIGQQVGQGARFLFDIEGGDYVITPAANTELLHFAVVQPDPSYFYDPNDAGCPNPHRRRVKWDTNTLKRTNFSVSLQNTLRSTLTVFYVSQKQEFFETIGRSDLAPRLQKETH